MDIETDSIFFNCSDPIFVGLCTVSKKLLSQLAFASIAFREFISIKEILNLLWNAFLLYNFGASYQILTLPKRVIRFFLMAMTCFDLAQNNSKSDVVTQLLFQRLRNSLSSSMVIAWPPLLRTKNLSIHSYSRLWSDISSPYRVSMRCTVSVTYLFLP